MASNIQIGAIQETEYQILSVLVGELLNEIMEKIGIKAFNFSRDETEARASKLISDGKYWVFVARETTTNNVVGFVSLYESYALYSEGAYGTMPEFYVTRNWRSRSVGQKLLNKVVKFAQEKGWHRIEVTTPPLPEFDRTLSFYHSNGFEITGGRKLKIDIKA
jgi:ribosomal protein S18 acetylase RimI-like enzyme